MEYGKANNNFKNAPILKAFLLRFDLEITKKYINETSYDKIIYL